MEISERTLSQLGVGQAAKKDDDEMTPADDEPITLAD
jgi:hypothetical protein